MAEPEKNFGKDVSYELNPAEHPEITGEDDGELTEELAATTTIEELLDAYITDVQAMFSDAIDISVEGNPVKTHIELTNLGNDVIEFAYELRRQLLERLADRAEQFPEQGNLLRKQVVGDSEEEN